MDTKHAEQVAEDLIASRLQQSGLFVAKPKFDQLGTDLLVFSEVGDGSSSAELNAKADQ